MLNSPFSLGFLIKGRQENTGLIYTTPGDSNNGSFIFPRTWPMNFRETSTVNISWTTNYEGVSLYFYQRGKVVNSTQIATNLGMGWYQWEVKTEEKNLTEPFVFRVVNARGTEQEAAGGGFWSTSFYILRDAPFDTTTSLKPSLTSLSSSALSSSSSSSHGLLSTITITLPSTPLPTETTQTPPVQGSAPNAGTIAGISVASAVVLAGILAAAYIWHRKRKTSNPHQPTSVSVPPFPANQINMMEEYKTATLDTYTGPPELPAAQVFHELPLHSR